MYEVYSAKSGPPPPKEYLVPLLFLQGMLKVFPGNLSQDCSNSTDAENRLDQFGTAAGIGGGEGVSSNFYSSSHTKEVWI